LALTLSWPARWRELTVNRNPVRSSQGLVQVPIESSEQGGYGPRVSGWAEQQQRIEAITLFVEALATTKQFQQ